MIHLSLTRPGKGSLLGTPSFSSPLAAEPLWKTAQGAGVPVTVLRWPLTFPAEGKGEILSGLGTPDITGRLGSYVLYTTHRFDPGDDKARHTVTLSGPGPYKSRIPGPLTATPRAGDPLAGHAVVEFSIRPLKDKPEVEIEAAGKTFRLAEGKWSEILSFSFSLGWLRSCRGTGQFFLARARDPLLLYFSPTAIDPLDPVFPIAAPEKFSSELANAIGGRFHTLGMPEDTKAVTDGAMGPEAFLASCDGIMREQERMLEAALDRRSEGLLAMVFFTPDRIQHLFWAGLDPEHPFNRPKPGEDPLFDHRAEFKRLGGKPIRDYYERLDRIVGALLGKLAERDLLLVLSDHGFTTFRRAVNINRFLVDEKYMTLTSEEGEGLFQSVKWDRTRAYACGFAGIYLNRSGRESGGVVERKEAAELEAEIAAKLTSLTDPETGKRPVRHVWRREEIYSGPRAGNAPDLVLGMEEGYRFSWQTALGAAPKTLFEDNDRAWSGTHLIDPGIVPGILLASKPLQRKKISGLDVFPTVLNALGVETPERAEGKDFIGSA